MNTNWARILLFTLLGFSLGWIMSCLMCAPCMGRGDCGGGSCHGHSECRAEASCGHGGGHGKKACCKGGKDMHMEADSMGLHHGHHHENDSTQAH